MESINQNIHDATSIVKNEGGNAPAVSMSEPEATSVQTKEGMTGDSQTTKFIDDATVTVRDESMIAHVSKTITDLNDTQLTEQSLRDFLSKPIILSSGTFSTTDTFSLLNSYSMPFTAFNSGNGVVWAQKLAGFFGIRMDMRFRIVVNANRMQQGRYIIGWVPLASPKATLSSLKNFSVVQMHLASLVQRTTVPHVELDLATGTTAELLIPFTSVQNFYPLNSVLSATDITTLGYMNVYPYEPLVSPTGPTTCGYTLYVSFENVQLFGAASAQSGISDREVSNNTNGPISGSAKAFARGFREFGQIPLIGEYAKSVSWIADRISKTAGMFGFSKPTQGDSIGKMQLVNCPAHTTVDGDSDMRPLSYLSKPGVVEVNGLAGTDYDEMDFSYVVRKYAWFRRVPWTLATPTGNLASIAVYPTAGNYTVGGAVHLQPVAFVGSLFNMWRGSLKYKFKFVKTEFHSGRLQFCFYPTDESSYTGQSAYVNRMIVDVRETTEVEIIVPYISRFPWQQKDTSIGVLTIDVVDPLVAPANVSSSIAILCEIAGGDDMEFAVPAICDYVPTTFVPQSGVPDNDKRILTATIGNSQVNANPLAFSSMTIGDKVSSLRAYLRRFHPILPNSKATASTSNLNGSECIIWPDAMYVLGATLPTYYITPDMISFIGSSYAIWRGGVRIRDVIGVGLLNPAVTATNSPASAMFNTVNNAGIIAAPINTQSATGAGSTNFHLANQNIFQNNVMTVEVPQYTGCMARAKVDVMTFVGSPSSYGYNNTVNSSGTAGYLAINLPSNSITASSVQAGFNVHNLYRALADDGGFSCFISVPPMQARVTATSSRGYY